MKTERLLYVIPALLVAATVLTSCGNKNKAGAPPPPPPPAPAPGPAPVVYHTLKLPPLGCSQQGGCPTAFGELVSVTSGGVRFCTVTMVSPDIALTAVNCIARENVAPNQTYRGNCWVRFPGNEAPVACASVAFKHNMTSGQELVDRDYAFIKLAAPAGRQAIGFAAESEKDQLARRRRASEVIVYGTQVGAAMHSLRRLKCVAELRQNGPTRVFRLLNCPTEGGFSGGPIVNPRTGNILGVISREETRAQK